MANHILICGMTASGKSFAAKKLAQIARRKGRKVLVYDPFLSGYYANFRTANLDQLLYKAKTEKNCLIVIDEAAYAIGSGLGERAQYLWFATMSRHCGHQCVFITQRLTGLSPVIRDNCKTLFLFGVHSDSAKMAAEAYNDEGLCAASNLEKYYFFKKEYFKPVKKLKF